MNSAGEDRARLNLIPMGMATAQEPVPLAHVPPAHLLGVLAGDAGGDDVAPGHRGVGGAVEADGRIAPGALPVQHPDVFDPVQGDAHCNLREKRGGLSCQNKILASKLKAGDIDR